MKGVGSLENLEKIGAILKTFRMSVGNDTAGPWLDFIHFEGVGSSNAGQLSKSTIVNDTYLMNNANIFCEIAFNH